MARKKVDLTAADSPAVTTAPAQAGGVVRVIQVDTRDPYQYMQGAMRTWPGGANHPDIRQRYLAANPVPLQRPFHTLTALLNAYACKKMGWTYQYAHVEEPADRHSSWIKLRHALHCWEQFGPDDIVLILDTDAWLRDPAGFKHVLDSKLTGSTLYLAAGEPNVHESAVHGAELMNGGFMCFRIDDRVKQYLQAAYDMPQQAGDGAARYMRDWPWDQAGLCWAYRQNVADCREWTEILPLTLCNTPAGTHVTHCWFKDIASDLCVDDLLSLLAEDLLSCSKPTLEIVVAKYQEDATWVYDWAPYATRITVYDKSDAPMQSAHPKVRVVPLPNTGREAHTYAHHMHEHYDDLCDLVVCTQAGFQDHMNRQQFDELVRTGQRATCDGLDIAWSNTVMQHFGWTPEHNYAVGTTMTPAGMSMAKFFLKYVGDDIVPEPQLRWWQGAIFRTGAAEVRRRPRERYAAIRDALGSCSNPEAAHYMERFWGALLRGG